MFNNKVYLNLKYIIKRLYYLSLIFINKKIILVFQN
jgi:hypothetical protein